MCKPTTWLYSLEISLQMLHGPAGHTPLALGNTFRTDLKFMLYQFRNVAVWQLKLFANGKQI